METNKLLEIEYLAKKYDETNIPLYLSYPTTSYWKDRADRESYAHSYAESFRQSASPFLYFHFPYCRKACYYCCCYKTVTSDESEKDRYVTYLEKELKLKLEVMQSSRLSGIAQMHWGGGTPTYLTCSQIERAFAAISQYAELATGSGSSLSVEAYPDPEILTQEKLSLLRGLGFNELSLGVQDFDDRIQKTINRNCHPDTVKEIIARAKDLGFRIHIDLCYGLPFQGLNELERTIGHVREMAPDRIAAFPYAHYPLSFPLQREIPASSLPNSYIKILLIRHAAELLTESGYEMVGIDHFVKKENRLCRAAHEGTMIKDFMGYSVGERRSFIGFGASAIGFSGETYYHNTCSLAGYFASLDRNELPIEPVMSHTLSGDDLIRREIIEQSLLCDLAIDKAQIEKKYNINFDAYFNEELKTLATYEKDGLVTDPAARVMAVTQDGRFMARHIAHLFDSYYNGKRR